MGAALNGNVEIQRTRRVALRAHFFYVIMMPLNVNGCFRILSYYITGNILFSDFIIPFNIKNSKNHSDNTQISLSFCHIY